MNSSVSRSDVHRPYVPVTKTLGPLHFEDLEPHRFEDLVRELVYDFKDWQSIEATGRLGSDDGFDIRAYERVSAADREPEDRGPDEDGDEPHPMEGNLWMFQCKREAKLGPGEVSKIIKECINAGSPPYGFVLAAPANFSKKSFDAFRDELRRLGVMEFYLWGRGAIEDMLHQPKNDRVLFTFFGISLVSRRRSRATDVRATVARKNKLMRILNGQPSNDPILLRDLSDTHYPYKGEYKDFETRPRWCVRSAIDLHPRGLIFRLQEHLAYWDEGKGEWDATETLNLARRREEDDHEQVHSRRQQRELIEGFWDFLPHANRVTFVRNGLVLFEDMVVIDDKGDSEFQFPHIFVDFRAAKGPFVGVYEFLRIHEHRHVDVRELKRIKRFPASFDKPRIGKIHDTKLRLPGGANWVFSEIDRSNHTLYDVEGRLDFLAETDVIAIEESENKKRGSDEPTLIQITHKRSMGGAALLDLMMEDPSLKHRVDGQIGRELLDADQVRIVEFKRIHRWALEKAGSALPKGMDERLGRS
jgi:hypothetical protein